MSLPLPPRKPGRVIRPDPPPNTCVSPCAGTTSFTFAEPVRKPLSRLSFPGRPPPRFFSPHFAGRSFTASFSTSTVIGSATDGSGA
jgi:hypothetical protein